MMSWSPMSLRTMRIVCGSPLSIRRRKDCTRYECPLWHPRKACHKPHPHFHPSRDRSSLRWRSGRAKICHRSYQILRKIDSPLSSSFAISRLGCISTTPVQSSGMYINNPCPKFCQQAPEPSFSEIVFSRIYPAPLAKGDIARAEYFFSQRGTPVSTSSLHRYIRIQIFLIRIWFREWIKFVCGNSVSSVGSSFVYISSMARRWIEVLLLLL
jgi:hypothetical protein